MVFPDIQSAVTLALEGSIEWGAPCITSFLSGGFVASRGYRLEANANGGGWFLKNTHGSRVIKKRTTEKIPQCGGRGCRGDNDGSGGG